MIDFLLHCLILVDYLASFDKLFMKLGACHLDQTLKICFWIT